MAFLFLTSLKGIRTIRTIGRFNYRLYSSERSDEVTAGILIIGDEILKGTTDANTPFLIKQLNYLNVKIRKVAIVPDNIDAIAEEVAELSSKCTYVFTSGGIGPTHDDVTYEAVAKACQDELQLNENLLLFLVNYFGPKSVQNPGVIKYSHVPKSSFVTYIDLSHENRIIKFPIVSIRNIYMFPGVPGLLRKCFNALKTTFAETQKKFSKDLYINLDEFTVIKTLNIAVKKFEEVNFGSYPTFTNNYYKVKLSLESLFQDKMEEAYQFLSEHLPEHSMVNMKNNFLLTVANDVYSLSLSSPSVLDSITVIEKAMTAYAPSELCVCFNGGKDCTALLHLLYACVQKLKPNDWNKVNFLYIKNGDCFEEIDNFIHSTEKLYDFKLTILEGELKQSVSYYLETNSNVKAMLMGTRMNDPGASNLMNFSSTDSDWPSVLRILPILSWSYSDVWYFIRKLHVRYCILYDRGYTSLGTKSSTVKNPSLILRNGKDYLSYRPAYMLQDSENERNSRL